MTASSPTPQGRDCLASLPVAWLDALAALRTRPDILVTLRADRAWVRWPAVDDGVADLLRPVPGVRLYAAGGPPWRLLGRTLPDFQVPEDVADAGIALDRVLIPAPFRASPPGSSTFNPTRLRIVADSEVRPATALRCRLHELAAWAAWVPSRRFAPLTVAWAGETVVVRGEGLPEIVGARRFWGDRVLAPLGSRPEPGLREDVWLRLLGVGVEAVVLMDEDGIESIPAAAFGAMTRAGVRLAATGGGT